MDFEIVRYVENVSYNGDFDYLTFCVSPNYTPPAADFIVELIKSCMDYDRYMELHRLGKFQEAVEYKATQVPTRLVKYYSLNESFLNLIKINWKIAVGIRIW